MHEGSRNTAGVWHPFIHSKPGGSRTRKSADTAPCLAQFNRSSAFHENTHPPTGVDLGGHDVVVAIVVGHGGHEVAEQKGDDDVDAAHEGGSEDLQKNLSPVLQESEGGGGGEVSVCMYIARKYAVLFLRHAGDPPPDWVSRRFPQAAHTIRNQMINAWWGERDV